jgi:methionyl-tRNA formyltransferase
VERSSRPDRDRGDVAPAALSSSASDRHDFSGRHGAPAGRRLRIVFFGTPAFAVPALDALLRSRHPVVGVVTQPDRPRGRGQRVSDAPIKQRARDASLPVLQPVRLKDAAFVAALAAWDADLGVVAAYGRILTDDVLRTPRLGMINVHASLLPRYRGAAPVHRAIVNGERETGVTIMRVVQALDAGPMLAAAAREIGANETSVDVERDLAQLGASLLMTTVHALADGAVIDTPQDETQATYAHRLTKDDGAIDWTLPAARLHNLVRGLYPWPHAFTHLGGRRIIILRSTPVDAAASVPPGTIIAAARDSLSVAAGEGALRVLELQAEGKRPMTAREFQAGHRLVPGARFGS